MILLSLSLDCNQVGWNFIAACYQRCRPHRASLTDNWQIKTGINCFLRNAQWKEKEEKRMHRYLVQLFWNWKPWIEKIFVLKMKQTSQFRLKFWCEHTQPHMHTQQIFSKNYFLSLILEANEMRTRVSVKKEYLFVASTFLCLCFDKPKMESEKNKLKENAKHASAEQSNVIRINQQIEKKKCSRNSESNSVYTHSRSQMESNWESDLMFSL